MDFVDEVRTRSGRFAGRVKHHSRRNRREWESSTLLRSTPTGALADGDKTHFATIVESVDALRRQPRPR